MDLRDGSLHSIFSFLCSQAAGMIEQEKKMMRVVMKLSILRVMMCNRRQVKL